MKLPNYERAYVPSTKIPDYLLSLTHEDGRSKAMFFSRLGFSVARWQVLADALLGHVADHEVAKIESSPFGLRYVIEGTITTPGDRMAPIRSVWFIETGDDIPRFVTAYPLPRSKK